MNGHAFAATPPPFANRREGGIALARLLGEYGGRGDVLVLGLPRGGVPVAFEVARAVGAPLDVFVVRKLGLPGHPELAMGAIASGGARVLNEHVVAWAGLTPAEIDAVARIEQAELTRREQAYRGARRMPAIAGQTVILVDDGLATGSTMRAAVLAVRGLAPSRVIVAAPVGARDTCRMLMSVADDVVCARMPEPFTAVGLWYEQFDQTTDDEVRALLAQAHLPAERSA